jgi:hypothetical protein
LNLALAGEIAVRVEAVQAEAGLVEVGPVGAGRAVAGRAVGLGNHLVGLANHLVAVQGNRLVGLGNRLAGRLHSGCNWDPSRRRDHWHPERRLVVDLGNCLAGLGIHLVAVPGYHLAEESPESYLRRYQDDFGVSRRHQSPDLEEEVKGSLVLVVVSLEVDNSVSPVVESQADLSVESRAD